MTRRSERWAIESNAQVGDLAVTGDHLAGDTFRPGPVTIVGDLVQNPGWWKVRRLTVDSAVASCRAEGWLGEGRPRGGQGEKRRVEAQLDLAALARQLPRALRLRPGLAMERGRARVIIESSGPLDDSTTTLEATLADLAGRDGDRRLGLRDPATLSARVVRSGTDVAIQDLTARTSFLDAAVNGRLDDATLTGSVDLGRVPAAAGGVVRPRHLRRRRAGRPDRDLSSRRPAASPATSGRRPTTSGSAGLRPDRPSARPSR